MLVPRSSKWVAKVWRRLADREDDARIRLWRAIAGRRDDALPAGEDAGAPKGNVRLRPAAAHYWSPCAEVFTSLPEVKLR